jgi:hypothetical protein
VWIGAAIAATVALAVGVAFMQSPSSSREVGRLVSGSIRVNGEATSELRPGARVSVVGTKPAVLDLDDGSRVTLEPGSETTFEGAVGEMRHVVRLEQGEGGFEVRKGGGRFKVSTPLGAVTVLGTEFSVSLLREEEGMRSRAVYAMVVSVLAGSVGVECNGRHVTLTGGQSEVFAAEGRDGARGFRAAALPSYLRGFSGMVQGTVVKKGEGEFALHVSRLIRVWENNEAQYPGRISRRVVVVGAGRHEGRVNQFHRAFIAMLKTRQSITVEIANREGNSFVLLELNREQRQLVERYLRERGELDQPREGGEGNLREGGGRPRDGKGPGREGGEGSRAGRRFVLSERPGDVRFAGVVQGREGAKLSILVREADRNREWLPVRHVVVFLAQWEQREGGGWRPARRTMEAFESLRRGDTVRCSAYYEEHPRLAVIEVVGGGEGDRPREGAARPRETEKRRHGEQDRPREDVQRPREGDSAEGEGNRDAVSGFSGSVEGEVTAVGENIFALRVTRVVRVWRGNRARNPGALAGMLIIVGPRQTEAGPSERHLAFIRTLEKGQELRIEVRHGEGSRFEILELNAEQRERAGGAE